MAVRESTLVDSLYALLNASSVAHNKLLHVPLVVNIGQVWHHVSDNFEACILTVVKTLAHCTHSVSSETKEQTFNVCPLKLRLKVRIFE